jgi:PBP1b-binding outer membrane lipoprotein LpoB
MKLNSIASLILSSVLLVGCANTAKPPVPTQAAAPVAPATPVNDFPTLTRVEYVLSCMKEKGGKNYDNLYHCVCAVDRIAAQMPHEEFLQAETFETNKNLAGERGGLFRDPPQAKVLRDKLKTVTDEAIAACFPNGGKASGSQSK